MNRNIRWQTGAFDEMEFVYEKAMGLNEKVNSTF